MAGTSGQTTDPLIPRLERTPFEFDFFQAIRILQSEFSERPRIGTSISPAQDPVRFAQSPTLVFATSTIEKVQASTPAGVPRIFLNFFGLLGPNGPLPPHLTEYAREREMHHGDKTISAFINLFNHRLASFFFRAWAASQKTVDGDRPDDQSFPIYIGSLFGLGLESLQGRDAVPDPAKLYFAGRLACQTRNAEGLEALLQEYFEIATDLQPFTGRWMDLPTDSLCELGGTAETGSLGVNSIVGSRIWDCQLSFRLKMGPMSLRDYERMLPGGEAFQRLQSWIRNYCGEHYFWDVQLILRADEVPDIGLGKSGRLGWTTWMKTKPLPADAGDLILNPPES